MTARTPEASTVPQPFAKSPNPGLWHVEGMELPPYIQHVAHALLRDGSAATESQAIDEAVGIVKKWGAGVNPSNHGHVHPDVQAAALKNVADWEAKRARAHSTQDHAGGMHVNEVDLVNNVMSRATEAWPGMASDDLATHIKDAEAALGPNHYYVQCAKMELAKQTEGVGGTKKRLISHMRDVHRLSGSYEHQTLPQLHEAHAHDHMSGQVVMHPHPMGLEPKRRKMTADMANSFGKPLVYDPWGSPTDLATTSSMSGTRMTSTSSTKPKTVKAKGVHVGFANLTKRLMAKGHTKEDAMKIAASIGVKKYGAAKFKAMAVKGRKGGGANVR